MTRQKHENATYTEANQQSEETKHFKKILNIVWSKIIERFPTLTTAFRFFDTDFNQVVSFNEFVQGLENLRIKIAYDDMKKIFQYIDTNSDGVIAYEEFCSLCEEKWNNTDPFQVYQETIRSRSSAKASASTKVSTPTIEQLETMTRTRMSGYSLTKKKMNMTRYWDNQDRPFGVKLPREDNMDDIMQQSYVKQHLQRQMAKYQIMEAMKRMNALKEHPNRAS